MNKNLRLTMAMPDRGFWFVMGAGLALALLAWLLAPVGLARAALITPYMNFSAGYSDNIRLTKEPRSDFFLKAGPGIRALWKWPKHELTLSAETLYAHYLDLSDLSGFDSANAGIIYAYNPSPRWTFSLADQYTSTFDKPELSETNELVAVRGGTGRLDRNSFNFGIIHRYTSFDSIQLSYTNTYTRGEDENSQSTFFNRLAGIWTTRLNPKWQYQAGGSVVHTTYSDTPSEDRGRVFTRLTRLMGPNLRVWGEMAYAINRSLTDDEATQGTRNYELLNLTAGIAHNVSPRLDWQFAAGWSHVYGQPSGNSAAGRGFPILNAKIKYTGRRWTLIGYAVADMGQFDYLGDNRGLAVSHRMGLSWSYKLTRLQNLTLTADYSRNDFTGNDEIDLNSTQGVVNSYRFTANWSWQIHKKLRLSLQYYYLNRDSEQDNDDRQQNQVMLILYTDYPFRW